MSAEAAQRRLAAAAFETRFHNPMPRFMSLTRPGRMQRCTRGQAPRPGSSAVAAARVPPVPGSPGAAPALPARGAPWRRRASAPARVGQWPPPRDYSSQQAVRGAAPAAEAARGAGPGAAGPWRAGGPRPPSTWSGCTTSSAGCTETCAPSPSGCGAAPPVRRGERPSGPGEGTGGAAVFRPELPRRLRGRVSVGVLLIRQACLSSREGAAPARLCVCVCVCVRGGFAGVGVRDVASGRRLLGGGGGSAVWCFQLLPCPGGSAGVGLHSLQLLCSGKFQLHRQARPCWAHSIGL